MRNVSLAVVIASMVLAGCSTPKVVQAPAASSSSSSVATTASVANPPPAAAPQSLTAEQAAKQAAEKAGMVIYFDYDSADIKPEFNALVAAHAKYLTTNASLKVRLEGNTDERSLQIRDAMQSAADQAGTASDQNIHASLS